MKLKKFSERGQALIVMALAAVGLFAIMGLAIDGSAKFSDRRHAQNAVDTAAMAAALSATRGDAENVWGNKARDIAEVNGYNGDLVRSQVWVYKCSNIASTSPVDCGPYNGSAEHIQVVIRSYVNTYFARVIGINQTQNLVQAVTKTKQYSQLYGGHTIVALNPNPCSGGGADGNITLGTAGGGTAEINFSGGGLFLNSGGSGCGMNLTGCPVLTVSGGAINSAGDGNVNLSSSSGSCSATINVPSAPNYNQPQYQFPPDMPKEPSECFSTTAATYSSNSATQTTTLNPGKYYGFPPKGTPSNPVYDKVFMNPGIYCIEDMVKLNDQKLTLTGNDVLLYLRDGYKFDIQGGTMQLTGRTSGPYTGYLIIVDTNFTGQPTNCNILGNGSNVYQGTIFAPYCNVTISGTTDDTSYSIQLIAYTVKIVGSAKVNFTYDPGLTAKNFPEVGLMR
jgi:Flp pilus assembly protein TadG